MEDLIAGYPSEFFPRHRFTLQGRQGHFQEVGRYDLLFVDEFGTQVLMELKAVPAKYENATQLARYSDALRKNDVTNVQMWLVAPSIPRSVRDFLDQIGIEYTEIHEAEFRKVAARNGYTFGSEGSNAKAAQEKTIGRQEQEPIPATMPLLEAPTVGASTEEVHSLATFPVPATPQIGVTVEMRGEDVVLKLDDREYRARGLKKNASEDALRVNLRVMGVNAHGDVALHVDTLELNASRQRMAFIKQAAEELGVKEEVIRHDVGQVLLKLEEVRDAYLAEAPQTIGSLASSARPGTQAPLKNIRQEVGDNAGIDNIFRSLQRSQNAVLLKCLRRYVDSPFSGAWIKAHRVTQQMHSNRIVTYAYIQHNTAAITCFRKADYPSQALKRCIEDALRSGVLSHVQGTRSNGQLYSIQDVN